MNHLPLGDISLDLFLDQYWQKKPLLIRNALPNISSPISAEELAGLACEDSIEARLIINQDDTWTLKHGPFDDNAFADLPEYHWTLLVQAVDHYVPAASKLLELFNFIPRWRIDDLMMSYAPKGGGVGPHFDNYDVFLVQTQGQRLWQIGGHYSDESPLEDGLPVKIVKNFAAEESWILNPGDILYVPPGVGHNGIAQSDDCMTCSIGFYAPSHSEILREYSDFIGAKLSDSMRYEDPDLITQDNTGEINRATIEKIQTILEQHLQDPELISDWFGRYITTPKYQQLNELGIQQSEITYTLAELKLHLAADIYLQRNESSRFAYQAKAPHQLFVDGQLIHSNTQHNEIIELLCNRSRINSTDFSHNNDNLSLLLDLLNRGALYLTE